ncbi:MAG: hypothetical protein ACJ8LN_06985 [Sulfurifustis sp.]
MRHAIEIEAISVAAYRRSDMQTLRSCFGLALVTCAIALTACAGTKVQEQFTDAQYTKKLASQSVMVIAASKRPDLRRTFEDQMVARLRAAGVNASPSYQYLPGDEPAAVDTVKQTLERNGMDAVLIARLLKTGQTGQMVDPQLAHVAGFYNSAYDETGGYAYRTYSSDVRIFDAHSDKLVWAGTVETTNPNDKGNDVTKIAKEYSDKVVKVLSDRKLIS